ncbi:hypothetical protein BLL52_2823 [Rhodoferax antarcticus ANT.BR]|uniref:Uncharacterized protein n=1 Tax=Rhodoferax antarcticus ANT.BR TaxID=1111071 RepID=A0A1Q8YF03_9BURK|nr:hypothetical protein BLL52_2823 [Rhodoferax antarcticus ANT.BR]
MLTAAGVSCQNLFVKGRRTPMGSLAQIGAASRVGFRGLTTQGLLKLALTDKARVAIKLI